MIIIESYNNNKLPKLIIANSVKIVHDPSVGVKQEMFRIYSDMNN
jgi:hypothetical protein